MTDWKAKDHQVWRLGMKKLNDRLRPLHLQPTLVSGDSGGVNSIICVKLADRF
jgi:hypothetical protein